MKGREVIKINRTLTLDEFETFMNDHWDKERFGEFKRGRPTPASIEEYILLPATANCLVCAYPRTEKIIFTVADSPEGVKRIAFSVLPTNNNYVKIMQDASMIARAKEFRGPAHEVNQMYAEYMRGLLAEAGLLK